jgi:hypothetical protein
VLGSERLRSSEIPQRGSVASEQLARPVISSGIVIASGIVILRNMAGRPYYLLAEL